jgi:DNA-binding Xre family transcriptional regulator
MHLDNPDNNILIDKFRQLGLSEDNIYNFLIRKDTSIKVKNLLEIIEKDTFNINKILNIFFDVVQLKPITCNKKILSNLTGISERQIDKLRKEKKISFIELSGNDGVGRKTILFNPDDFKKEILNPLYKKQELNNE